MMFGFWIILIILVIYPLRFLDPPISTGSYYRPDVLDILRERYARGEIDEEEFRQRRQELLR